MGRAGTSLSPSLPTDNVRISMIKQGLKRTCGPRFRDKVDVDRRQPCPSPKLEARISRLSVLARCPHALRRGQPGGRLASSAAGSQLPAGLRRWPPQHGLPVRPPPGAPARSPSSSLQLSGACSCGHAAPLRHGIRNLRDIFKEATRRVAAESAVVPRSPHPGGALSGEAAPAEPGASEQGAMCPERGRLSRFDLRGACTQKPGLLGAGASRGQGQRGKAPGPADAGLAGSVGGSASIPSSRDLPQSPRVPCHSSSSVAPTLPQETVPAAV